MNYLQKKKQAIIMMLAAQIIKTAQGYPVAINDCESGTAVDYTVWGNTIADGDTVMYVGDKTKNLIPYPYHESTKTVNGITFTDNGDGSVTVSGTATEYADFNFVQALPCRPNQAYTIVKNGVDVNNVSFVFCDVNENGTITRETVSTTREKTFTVTTLASTAYIKLLMKRQNNAECTGTVKPTLELGTTATEYEPYGYKIPIVNSSKNLIPYPYHESTKTVNGITFTDNGDGTITVNGTATADSRLLIKYDTSLLTVDTGKSYVLSGCPAGGSTSTYLLLAFDNKSGYGDLGNGAVFTPKTNKLELSIRIYSGATVENLTFKPQLELGETATEYEPRRAPSTANIYLDEPLKQGESINFGADNLPGLQLFEGSNVITADTAVKPSDIEIRYTVKQ